MPYMLFSSSDRSIGGALLSHAIRTADRAGRVVAARLLTSSHSLERLAAVISHLL